MKDYTHIENCLFALDSQLRGYDHLRSDHVADTAIFDAVMGTCMNQLRSPIHSQAEVNVKSELWATQKAECAKILLMPADVRKVEMYKIPPTVLEELLTVVMAIYLLRDYRMRVDRNISVTFDDFFQLYGNVVLNA